MILLWKLLLLINFANLNLRNTHLSAVLEWQLGLTTLFLKLLDMRHEILKKVKNLIRAFS